MVHLLEHLERTLPGFQLRGSHCVVLGRSVLVGQPAALMLTGKDASVTLLHSQSGDLARYLRDADVVVAATGVPRLIRAHHLKPGAPAH